MAVFRDYSAIREQLIAAGLLRPGNGSLRRPRTDGQPVLRIDSVGRAAAAKAMKIGEVVDVPHNDWVWHLPGGDR